MSWLQKMSKAEKDHDETLSVASDDDGRLQYNPSFETVLREDDDDSSVPPPPPPLQGRSLAKLNSSIFRARNREPKQLTAADDEEVGNRPVQILPAQDAAKSNIEVDAAEQWIKKFGMNEERNGQKRRSMMCTAILLTLVIIMGIAIIASQGSDKARRNQSEKMLVNNSTSPVEESTPSPAPGAQETATPGNATEPPVATSAPAGNVTDDSAEPCTTAIESEEACYAPQSEITISFTNCEAQASDWIGIWKVEDVINVTGLPEPQVWQWTCGAETCDVAVEQDSVTFTSGLRAGTYVAQFLHTEEDRAPYTGAFASSSTFEVARNCR